MRFEHPGIEGQAAPAEFGEPFAEVILTQQTLRRMKGRTQNLGVRVPSRLMPDAAKPPIPGFDQSVQHCARLFASLQVGVTDDTGAGSELPIQPAGALCGDTVHIFDFADDLELSGSARIVERPAFHEDRADDVVTGSGVI